MPRTEDGTIFGNVYPKYTTSNPIARMLMSGFFRSLDGLVDQVQPARIHEVGCGEGYLIARFRQRGRELQGSDVDPRAIAEARRLHGDLGVEFKVAGIYDLHVPVDASPLILCCEVLEHLERPVDALEILSRLARPFLIVSVPREPLWRFLNALGGRYLGRLGDTPGHINHWNRSSLVRLLETRFEVVRPLLPIPWIMALCKVR